MCSIRDQLYNELQELNRKREILLLHIGKIAGALSHKDGSRYTFSYRPLFASEQVNGSIERDSVRIVECPPAGEPTLLLDFDMNVVCNMKLIEDGEFVYINSTAYELSGPMVLSLIKSHLCRPLGDTLCKQITLQIIGGEEIKKTA